MQIHPALPPDLTPAILFPSSHHLCKRLPCSECPESVMRMQKSSGCSWSAWCTVSIWFRLLYIVILALMLDSPYRRLRHSPHRRLLRPMGEVFEQRKDQPPYGIRHCVLWALGHHCERSPQIITQDSPGDGLLVCRMLSSRSIRSYKRFCKPPQGWRSI